MQQTTDRPHPDQVTGVASRATAVKAGGIGAGCLAVAVGAPQIVAMLGLWLAFPREEGGADLGTAAIVITYTLDGLIAVGSMVATIALLRRLKVTSPILVGVAALVSTLGVLLTLALAASATGGAPPSPTAVWLMAGFTAFATFAAATRFGHRRRVLVAVAAAFIVIGAGSWVAARQQAVDHAAQARQRDAEQLARELNSEFDTLTAPPHVLDTGQWRITNAEMRTGSLLVTQVSVHNPSMVVKISAYRNGADNAPPDVVCDAGNYPPEQTCTVDGDQLVRRDARSARITDFALIRPGYRIAIIPEPPHQDIDPRSLVGLVRPPTPTEFDQLRALAVANG